MKYKQEIIFENESANTAFVEKYKDDIIKHVKAIVENSFDFDIVLIVRIKDIVTKENYVNKETTCGYSTWRKDGSYVVCLSSESLERIRWDNGLDIAVAICHELCHIYDMYHVMNNKYYKINPLMCKQTNINDYIIQQGWNFWTEFFAYYFTFKEFKNLHDYPTFHQLLIGYQHLLEQYKFLEPKLDDKTKKIKDLADKHIEEIKQFIYALAKYLAGSIMGKPKYYKVKVTKENKKTVSELNKIVERLYGLIIKMFTNTHGKGMATKLWKIGDYLIRTFYVKYNIFPEKLKGHIALAYYKND